MDTVKTLIRTVVRSFYSNPKQILIIDALLIHSVLHVDDLNVLLSTQQKEIRKLIVPLKRAHLLDSHSKVEAKIGQSRGSARDYYYIPFHPAIDAIKYRITKLTDKVKDLYQPEAQRKEWRCPRCRSEYDTFQVLPYTNDEGFGCEKCGATLEETPQAKDAAGMIGHEKHSRLMDQLGKILALMQQVDRLHVPENDFDTAWEKKKEVPRERGQHARREYVAVPGTIKVAKAGRTGPEVVKAEALGINLTSGEEHDAADQARREAKKAELAKQNMLPVWHTQSTVSGTVAGAVKVEDAERGGKMFKEESVDEKKPMVDEQDDLAAYLAEMKREKEEAERKAAAEDLESDEMDGDDFEDVISTNAGTPLNGTSTPLSLSQHQQPHSANGFKREFDSESGPSSDANTPVAGTPSANDGSDRDLKRVKFENKGDGKAGPNDTSIAAAKGVESEDEEDFEDAM